MTDEGQTRRAPRVGGASRIGVSDTPREVEALRAAAFRCMPPHEKLRKVVEMNRAVEAMAAARIRAEHGPDLSAEELELRLAVLRNGAELTREASGWDADERGR